MGNLVYVIGPIIVFSIVNQLDSEPIIQSILLGLLFLTNDTLSSFAAGMLGVNFDGVYIDCYSQVIIKN